MWAYVNHNYHWGIHKGEALVQPWSRKTAANWSQWNLSDKSTSLTSLKGWKGWCANDILTDPIQTLCFDKHHDTSSQEIHPLLKRHRGWCFCQGQALEPGKSQVVLDVLCPKNCIPVPVSEWFRFVKLIQNIQKTLRSNDLKCTIKRDPGGFCRFVLLFLFCTCFTRCRELSERDMLESCRLMCIRLNSWSSSNGYGSIPIDTFLVGWTSIYQLFWGSLGTRVLTHPQINNSFFSRKVVSAALDWL